MSAAPVTLLFTDLVESTALLQRVGDERAQRVLHAHRQLLRETLASHGGREVKWLGDGLLTTFASVADGRAPPLGPILDEPPTRGGIP